MVMTLEKLQSDMYQAMKDGDKVVKQVLSTIIDAVKKTAINKKRKDDIDEALIDEVLIKVQKELQEAIDTCPSTHESVKLEYECQMSVVKCYAPQLITDENAIKAKIEGLLVASNIQPNKSAKGAIMKVVMPVLKGKVDMGKASKILSEMLV